MSFKSSPNREATGPPSYRISTSSKTVFSTFKQIFLHYKVSAIKSLLNITLCFYTFDYTLLDQPKYCAAHSVKLGNSPDLFGPAWSRSLL